MFTVKVVSIRLGIQQLIAFTKPTNKSRQIPITIDGNQSTEAKYFLIKSELELIN